MSNTPNLIKVLALLILQTIIINTYAQFEHLPDNYPWLVAIMEKGNNQFICAGTILDRQWILTSANPLADQRNADQILVLAGVDNYNQILDAQLLEVELVKIGDGHEIPLAVGNTALIKLKTPLSFDKDVLPLNMQDIWYMQSRILAHYSFANHADYASAIQSFLQSTEPQLQFALGWDIYGNKKAIEVRSQPVKGNWFYKWQTGGKLVWGLSSEDNQRVDSGPISDNSITEYISEPFYYSPSEDPDLMRNGFGGGPLVSLQTYGSVPVLSGVGTWWTLSDIQDMDDQNLTEPLTSVFQGRPDATGASCRWFDYSAMINPFVIGITSEHSSNDYYTGYGNMPAILALTPEVEYTLDYETPATYQAREIISWKGTELSDLQYVANNSILLKPGFHMNAAKGKILLEDDDSDDDQWPRFRGTIRETTEVMNPIVSVLLSLLRIENAEARLVAFLITTFLAPDPWFPFLQEEYWGSEDDDHKDETTFDVVDQNNRPFGEVDLGLIDGITGGTAFSDFVRNQMFYSNGMVNLDMSSLTFIREFIASMTRDSRYMGNNPLTIPIQTAPHHRTLYLSYLESLIEWDMLQIRNNGSLEVTDIPITDLISDCVLRQLLAFVYHHQDYNESIIWDESHRPLLKKIFSELLDLALAIIMGESREEFLIYDPDFLRHQHLLFEFGFPEEINEEPNMREVRDAIPFYTHGYNTRGTLPGIGDRALYTRMIEQQIDWTQFRGIAEDGTFDGVPQFLQDLIIHADRIVEHVQLEDPDRRMAIMTLWFHLRDTHDYGLIAITPHNLRWDLYQQVTVTDNPICEPKQVLDEIKECEEHREVNDPMQETGPMTLMVEAALQLPTFNPLNPEVREMMAVINETLSIEAGLRSLPPRNLRELITLVYFIRNEDPDDRSTMPVVDRDDYIMGTMSQHARFAYERLVQIIDWLFKSYMPDHIRYWQNHDIEGTPELDLWYPQSFPFNEQWRRYYLETRTIHLRTIENLVRWDLYQHLRRLDHDIERSLLCSFKDIITLAVGNRSFCNYINETDVPLFDEGHRLQLLEIIAFIEKSPNLIGDPAPLEVFNWYPQNEGDPTPGGLGNYDDDEDCDFPAEDSKESDQRNRQVDLAIEGSDHEVDIAEKNNTLLYPNPTSGEVTLSIQSSETPSTTRIGIYSLAGILKMEISFIEFLNDPNKFKMNLDELTNGIYVMKVDQGDGQSYSLKLEIKH